jgi:hypothetical protein
VVGWVVGWGDALSTDPRLTPSGRLVRFKATSVNRWEICLSMREQNELRNIAWNTRNACLQKGAIV